MRRGLPACLRQAQTDTPAALHIPFILSLNYIYLTIGSVPSVLMYFVEHFNLLIINSKVFQRGTVVFFGGYFV